jgi:hypothetical protein
MVEPVLPFIGITFTAITFLLFIRNAIEKITRDYSDVKDDHEVLIPLAFDLLLLEHKLEEWQRLWYIPKERPEEMSESMWGEEGAGMIRVTLGDIQIKLDKLSKDFTKRYGNEKFAVELEKLETSESWTRTTMQTKLHAAFSVHKLSSGTAKRIKTALIHTPIFKEQVKGLVDLLPSLRTCP